MPGVIHLGALVLDMNNLLDSQMRIGLVTLNQHGGDNPFPLILIARETFLVVLQFLPELFDESSVEADGGVLSH